MIVNIGVILGLESSKKMSSSGETYVFGEVWVLLENTCFSLSASVSVSLHCSVSLKAIN